MRLSRVKLSGFKSFVDPTTFVLTGKLNGIVGPNGCGKSNIIDAVRWVMGESSAKQLRGESMSDVIFNGSERRKPAGMASIELIFENEEGRLGGKWAEYREISVRRTLDREGKSQYFLNGTRCRRRDITDIFLGTGLGPRSYAIIEQGMISRIVESKADDLRSFFEEAANISKYKERRHETALRIEHTRDNLERLTDIRSELGKQLTKLERQAATAMKYQALKEEARALGYVEVASQKADIEAEIAYLLESSTQEYEAFQLSVAEFNQVTTALSSQKQAFEALEQTVSQKNSELYPYKQRVDHLKHEIIRIRALEAKELESQAEWQENGVRLETELASSLEVLEELQQKLEEVQFIAESESEQLWGEEEALSELEQSVEALQAEYIAIRDQISEIKQKLELNRHTKQYQLERAKAMDEEHNTLAKSELPAEDPASDEALLMEETLIIQQENQAQLESSIEAIQTEINTLSQGITNLEKEQRTLLASRNQLAGEVSMLEKMNLSDDKEAQSPLFEHLKVSDGWNGAVDTALRHQLLLSTRRQRGESYIAGEMPYQYSAQHLGYYVESDLALGSLLSHIYAFDDTTLDLLSLEKDPHFIALRERLALHEMIATKSGLLFGPDWAIYSTEEANFGILARQRSLEKAKVEIQEVDARLEISDETLYEKEARREALQQGLSEKQKQLQQLAREVFDLEKKLSLVLQAKDHQAKERHRIESRLAVLTKEQALNQESLSALEVEIEAGEKAYAELEQRWQALSAKFDEEKRHYEARRKAFDQRKSHHLEQKRQGEQLQLQMTLHQERKNRAESELAHLRSRLESQQTQSDYGAQVAEIEESLLIAEEDLCQFEASLTDLHHHFETAKASIRELEGRKAIQEERLNAQKGALNQFSIREAELNTKLSIIMEQWDQLQLEMSPEEMSTAMAQYSELATAELKAALERTQNAIQKIGAVNLVAITECEELRERKSYLDTQNEDLEAALTMLEKAIKEIDDETRHRFMETFNAVNEDFSRLFPRLFGGGKAYLALTEDDALTSGVNIIAHPPGKKPGTIHLLSGGEKALTAMALVFAIFNLNPAPFCMLDEVDAPLDEANVRRLGELIDEMSEKVQFIFITHNKATMTISDSLIGVTMAEPGVSRLVSVSLKDAMEMVDE